MKKSLILALLFLLSTKIVSATLHINEIYPAPPTGEFEWVELYNDENNPFNIAGYYLNDADDHKVKIATDSIQPLSFIIATSSAVLNNSGDTVFLKNNLNETLEIATYAGTFNADKSYVRCPNGTGDWFALNSITKNSTNDPACLILTPTPTPSPIPTETTIPTPTQVMPTETPSPAPTSIPISYDNIFISEAMVNPEKGSNEWVEIYNNNNYSVDLSNWFIDDIENGGSSPKSFSLTIAAKGYGAYDLTSSMFNNGTDQVRLLDFDKTVKDSFEYQDSVVNETYGRINFEDDNFCLQEPSKGLTNNSCLNPTVEPSGTPSPTKTSASAIGNTYMTTKPVALPTNIVYGSQRIIDKNTAVPTGAANVLGADTTRVTPSVKVANPLVRSFSFTSFGYSFLSFVSIVLKIKKLSP